MLYPTAVHQVLDHLGGRLYAGAGLLRGTGDVAAGRFIERVVTDSARVVPGSLFVALRGRRRHGVEFLAEAAARGAAAVLTDSVPSEAEGSLAGPESPALIVVPDALVALQRLALWNRNQSDALCVGITGSVGKTTTRQMIYSVLSQQQAALQSSANFNNEIGLPLTLLELDREHRYAVLEMGAGRAGDIRFLCGLARPSWGVVTQVAPCHLESFGSLQAIQATKQELVEEIPSDGCVFLCADQAEVSSMSRVTAAKVLYFGVQAEGFGRCRMLNSEGGRSWIWCGGDEFEYEGGQQLMLCAAAAVCTGRAAGMTAEQIAAGLRQFRPDRGRGRLLRAGDWQILDETYNSSPASALACLRSIVSWRGVRRVLVLGDMLELGAGARAMHCEVASALCGSAVDVAVFCGEFGADCTAAARDAGFPADRLYAAADNQELQSLLSELLQPGDVVCIKGSRGLRLEQTVDWLLREAADRGGQVMP